MTVTVVRQKVKDGSLDEAMAATRDMFATLNQGRPEGLRYASTRVVDNSTFVAMFELDDGIEDPGRPSPSSSGSWSRSRAGWTDRR